MSSSQLHNHIVEAWKLTFNAQKIRRFNFWGSMLDTLVLSFVLSYQVGYVWLDIMDHDHVFFLWLKNVATQSMGQNGFAFFGSILFLGLGYFLINFLIKNIFNAGLIHLIRAYVTRNERQYRSMSAFAFGWKRSVKLSEYQAFLFWSKPVYIFTILFWGYRYFGENWIIVLVIAVIFIIALILTRFVFEYAKYYMVIEDSGVFESLGQSLTMTLENIEITARIFISLVFVYIRELVLIIGIFILPFVISWFIALGLAPIFLQGVFIIIGLVYFLFLIIVSAMNSVIEVFVESLWYTVFKDNLATSSTHSSHGSAHSGHHAETHSEHH